MSQMILFFALAVMMPVQATVLEFIGPCSEKPLFAEQVTGVYSNAGTLTVKTLEEKSIPFLGAEEGINSIFSTPVGLDAMEVISDNEMRAYGWCYNVDGEYPDVFANQVVVSSETLKVQWIFGYAYYLNGEWISQCEPSYKIKPQFLCGN